MAEYLDIRGIQRKYPGVRECEGVESVCVCVCVCVCVHMRVRIKKHVTTWECVCVWWGS